MEQIEDAFDVDAANRTQRSDTPPALGRSRDLYRQSQAVKDFRFGRQSVKLMPPQVTGYVMKSNAGR
jgi:hypothetical protein